MRICASSSLQLRCSYQAIPGPNHAQSHHAQHSHEGVHAGGYEVARKQLRRAESAAKQEEVSEMPPSRMRKHANTAGRVKSNDAFNDDKQTHQEA